MTFQAGLFDAVRHGQRVRTASFYLPESLDNRIGVVIRCVPHEDLRQLDRLLVRLEDGGEELELSRWQVAEL